MAQHLRALVALSEDPRLVPSTHIAVYIICNLSSRESDDLQVPLSFCAHLEIKSIFPSKPPRAIFWRKTSYTTYCFDKKNKQNTIYKTLGQVRVGE